MMDRWKITIEYDGSGYSGWQRQKYDSSIQQSIEDAIYSLSGQKVNLHAAGRTDAGVHALGQVAHFDINREFSQKSIIEGTNIKLLELGYVGIAIRDAKKVPDSFHARFSAVKRTYCYRIVAGRQSPLALDEDRLWRIKMSLNVDKMWDSSKYLLGKHDFSSFRASGCQASSPIKTIDRIQIIADTENPFVKGQYIEIWVEAKSFLYHQVRNIVGSLVQVGKNKWQPDRIKEVLEAKDRTEAADTAPANGLYFMKVDY